MKGQIIVHSYVEVCGHIITSEVSVRPGQTLSQRDEKKEPY